MSLEERVRVHILRRLESRTRPPRTVGDRVADYFIQALKMGAFYSMFVTEEGYVGIEREDVASLEVGEEEEEDLFDDDDYVDAAKELS